MLTPNYETVRRLHLCNIYVMMKLHCCYSYRIYSYALWDVKIFIVVLKNNGIRSWRLLSFLLLSFSPFLISVSFYIFCSGPSSFSAASGR